MTAVLVDTATAVVAALTDGDYSQEFTPRRSYADWELPLKKVTGLLCDVVPITAPKTELWENNAIKVEPAADIVFRRRFSVDSQNEETGKIKIEDIDALVALVEEVHASLCASRPEEFEDASCETPQIVMAYSAKHLREFRQFTGIIRVPYTVLKEL